MLHEWINILLNNDALHNIFINSCSNILQIYVFKACKNQVDPI